MNKQDLKIPTYMLRVNIHCDGCMHKIKNKLKKVKGVSKVYIDVEQDMVTVSGNVDPSILINTLEKAGKHAELLGPKKAPISVMSNQLKKFQIESTNGGKDGNNKPQQGFKVPQQMMNLKKGPNMVRFQLPEKEEDDDGSDDDDMYDEDEDDFDDESDDDYGDSHHHVPSKVAPVVVESKKGTPKGDLKGKDGKKGADSKGGSGKKGVGGGGGINMFLKGMLGKNGKVGKSDNKAGEHVKEGGKKKGKNEEAVIEKGKKGGAIGKDAKSGGKTNDSWNKKMGKNMNSFEGGDDKLEKIKQLQKQQQHGLNEMNKANHMHRGIGGGGGGGMMGHQMGDFPAAAQGLPAGMNFGHLQGQGNNPYNNNQQYMMGNMMMMNQQQGAYRHDNGYPPMGNGYPPMGGYGRQPPPPPTAMGYGPPPPMGGDPFTHIFSDENTDSCSIM